MHPYVAAVLEDEPIAYFRFEDDNSSIFDEIATGPLATAYGGVQYGQAGAVDSAIHFDGSTAGITVGDVLDFEGTDAMTLELWAKVEHTSSFQHLVTKRIDTESGFFGYSVSIQTGGNLHFMRANADSRSLNLFECPVDRFLHIVGTFEGTISRFYIDGEQVDDNPMADVIELPNLDVPLRFGAGTNFAHFQGTLDEIALYDHALTPERVAAHFEAAKAP